jgi:hypothetical protein
LPWDGVARTARDAKDGRCGQLLTLAAEAHGKIEA